MHEFYVRLESSITGILQPVVDANMVDLMDANGLLRTDDKLDEINEWLLDALLENPKIQKIDSTLRGLISQL